jgi:glycosyltransferase involved in cell wall biosynthesis
VKVVHISTYDCAGGAARAAHRLHEGLLRIGHESRMFVAHKSGVEQSVICYQPPLDIISRVSRTLRRRIISRDISRYRATAPAGLAFFTHDRTMYGGDPWRHLPENDLLQLHFVSKFMDYQSFFGSVPRNKQLVWTMHGMEALTGGCHYDYGCGKFAKECGACPQLGSHSESDLTRKVWRRKRESYQEIRQELLHIVSPSRWLKAEVGKSSLLSRFDCSVIPYGLDTDVFAPRDRRVAREILRIPLDGRVVLFLADGVDDPRKGFRLLAEAIGSVGATDNIFILSLGTGRPPRFRGIPHLHIEALQNDGMLSCIYSAADVFAIPSQQDNLPNTILEAMACGVPVVGFDVGGISDAVRPGVTGYLARAGDVSGLRNAILEILQDDAKRVEMAANCRGIALREYALEIQARRYAELYEGLMKKSGKETYGIA